MGKKLNKNWYNLFIVAHFYNLIICSKQMLQLVAAAAISVFEVFHVMTYGGYN